MKKNSQPKVGDTVWISCRAVESCEGKQAVIQMRFDQRQASLSPDGRSIRYVCETCKRPFHIRY